jgi:hypothetical protein
MKELGENDIDAEENDDVETDEDAVVDDDGDDAIDLTGEMNIESLVARLDSAPKDDVEHRRQIKKRLEELREAREAARQLDSTYNFDLDGEL